MKEETISKRVEEAVTRQAHHSNSVDNYARFFMRVSGTVLIGMALFHLLYMHFIIPGGVTIIDYQVVAARWTDPAWGFFWRFFDLLLLIFGFSHGGNGLRVVINDYVHHSRWRLVAKTLLYLICLVLMGLGGLIIFSFTPVN